MNTWNCIKKNHNTYLLSNEGKFISFVVNSTFKKDRINILSKDMTKDNIIFMKQLYPTEYQDDIIIGTAYKYKKRKMIDSSLVDLYIVRSNVDNAKDILESYWI